MRDAPKNEAQDASAAVAQLIGELKAFVELDPALEGWSRVAPAELPGPNALRTLGRLIAGERDLKNLRVVRADLAGHTVFALVDSGRRVMVFDSRDALVDEWNFEPSQDGDAAA